MTEEMLYHPGLFNNQPPRKETLPMTDQTLIIFVEELMAEGFDHDCVKAALSRTLKRGMENTIDKRVSIIMYGDNDKYTTGFDKKVSKKVLTRRTV